MGNGPSTVYYLISVVLLLAKAPSQTLELYQKNDYNKSIMKEITIKLTDKEYHQYVRKGQSEYRIRMKKTIEDEEYVKWMFMLGEYYRGQCA